MKNIKHTAWCRAIMEDNIKTKKGITNDSLL